MVCRRRKRLRLSTERLTRIGPAPSLVNSLVEQPGSTVSVCSVPVLLIYLSSLSPRSEPDLRKHTSCA
ncbi:hypothetical protein L596_011140 [Steinernema carpocapsae]|uniref:Uncharacterized protein n=1 Tax=Steinernema carpocapsae TaxID=34508 RepID=A0A4U5NTV7_STECR|nr:hypothetical protein L596_011140 [Steinernema carpocapsae]